MVGDEGSLVLPGTARLVEAKMTMDHRHPPRESQCGFILRGSRWVWGVGCEVWGVRCGAGLSASLGSWQSHSERAAQVWVPWLLRPAQALPSLPATHCISLHSETLQIPTHAKAEATVLHGCTPMHWRDPPLQSTCHQPSSGDEELARSESGWYRDLVSGCDCAHAGSDG